MTEEEAKTKWCPFARVALDHAGGAFNRWIDGQAVGDTSPALCIGSACTAWRQQTTIELRDRRSGALVTSGTIVMRDSVEERAVTLGGYCGLAGQP